MFSAASLCSEEWSEAIKKPSYLSKSTVVARSPEKEQNGRVVLVWGFFSPTAVSFFLLLN